MIECLDQHQVNKYTIIMDKYYLLYFSFSINLLTANKNK